MADGAITSCKWCLLRLVCLRPISLSYAILSLVQVCDGHASSYLYTFRPSPVYHDVT